MANMILQRIMSWLLFVFLVAFLVCSARFQGLQNFLLNRLGPNIGGLFSNLASTVSTGKNGKQVHGGDVIALLMFLIMLIDLVFRHSNRFYRFQHLVGTYLVESPRNIVGLCFSIALTYWLTNTGTDAHPPSYVQLLILLIFFFAMYSLFSSGDPPEYKGLSLLSRLFSRTMEYLLYTCFFPSYPVIWHWHIMAPLGLLVCVSRSNQIFRIWQNGDEEYRDFNDHEIVKKKFQTLYRLASNRIEKDLHRIPWPGLQRDASYKGYSTDLEAHDGRRLDTLMEELRKAGMYGYKSWKPYTQYCFFWSAGSGVLVFSGITLITIMLITASKLHDVSRCWNGLCLVSVAGVLLYLVAQCLPAFVVSAADIIATDSARNPEPDWMAWFCQIRSFMKVLMTEGLPLMEKRALRGETPACLAVLHGFEGLELVLYTLVYALARLIGLGLLFCILSLARKMKLGTAMQWLWSKLEPDLAFYSAKITALDIIRVKSAILQAEFALDTRIEAPCGPARLADGINTSPFPQQINVREVVEALDKALQDGETSEHGLNAGRLRIPNKEERKQAIAVGLYTSTVENLKDIDFPVEITARLWPLLSLLHGRHLHNPTNESAQVKDLLSLRFSGLSSLYLTEKDVKVMRVQLQASMLLYIFDEPSPTQSCLTAITLLEWLEIRRDIKDEVPGIEICDFLL